MTDSLQRKEILQRLEKIFSNLLRSMQEKDLKKRPIISFDTDIAKDLSIDSVETLDLLNSIEEEFEVSPDLHVANTKRKVGQIVDYIIELQEQK
ncbi:MAG TPA: phosphopantetheine-binding protein [Candidatus Omnitrophota bacterium]|nr:phosphopantetheine-binding protein [Candidatus Omnitrophota bacterium]